MNPQRREAGADGPPTYVGPLIGAMTIPATSWPNGPQGRLP